MGKILVIGSLAWMYLADYKRKRHCRKFWKMKEKTVEGVQATHESIVIRNQRKMHLLSLTAESSMQMMYFQQRCYYI